MHVYKLVSNQKISPTTQLITLENNEQGRPFGFQPGQYAAISFWHNGRQTPARCFSIVSSPTNQDILQFSLRINGHFTTAVGDLKPGDPVKIFGPFGGFILKTASDKSVIMLAGGIGITPFISMIRYATQLKSPNQIYLVYSVRSEADAPFADELLQHVKDNPNFHVLFVVADKKISKFPANHAIGGMINPELLDRITQKNYAERRYFICGPPGFMGAMTNTLLGKGVTKSSIMTESFSQASHPQSGILKSWPANVYAMSALGVFMGSSIVMVNDLIQNYQTVHAGVASVSAPYLITNARQQQLDAIVNSIPISPDVVISPTANKPAATTPAAPIPQPITIAPKYAAPTYTSTLAAPAPATGGHTTTSSDRRLKEYIYHLATLMNGLRIYRFRYIGQKQDYVGVMAQDLITTRPDAVVMDTSGYYAVHYDLLGLRMITLSEWSRNPLAIFTVK